MTEATSTWTDEDKKNLIELYTEENPTPETTTEIVKDLADRFGKTANGVRMILVKADVYVSKAKVEKKSSAKPKKAEQIAKLTSIIEANELEVDEEILNKLTGKAAKYFHDLFNQLTGVDDEED